MEESSDRVIVQKKTGYYLEIAGIAVGPIVTCVFG
jgi:hypothetical protein